MHHTACRTTLGPDLQISYDLSIVRSGYVLRYVKDFSLASHKRICEYCLRRTYNFASESCLRKSIVIMAFSYDNRKIFCESGPWTVFARWRTTQYTWFLCSRESVPKRHLDRNVIWGHLDRFSRFCRAHPCDQYWARQIHVETCLRIARI